MKISFRSTNTAVRLAFIIITLFQCGTRGEFQPRIQKTGLVQTAEAKGRAIQVKDAFLAAYRDYLEYAYPADEILPVTKKSQNTRNGWSATLVDSLDTLLLMDLKVQGFGFRSSPTSCFRLAPYKPFDHLSGMKEEFTDAVEKTKTIDFRRSKTWQTVSIMETTIRYLAAILSAYEMTGANNVSLLSQARTIGNTLATAWKTDEQQLPYSRFSTGIPVLGINTVSIAAAGTLILEFDRLSYYTKDPKYRLLAEKAERFLMGTSAALPGMPGLVYHVKNNQLANDWISWGGGADSYYEYLLKYAMLTHNADPSYLNAWRKAVDSSIEHLITTSPSQNLTYLAEYSPSKGGKNRIFSHLACFAGGNWMLGGQWLNNEKYLSYGVKLVETCMRSYTSTSTGLGPEEFVFGDPSSNGGKPESRAQDTEFFKKNDFYISDATYILRPEVIESVFYAWRITGDQKYQDFVWNAFTSLQKHCKAPGSYSSIDDVNSDKPKLTNNCESFLYSETFKYIYLTFAPPDLLSLDEYVYNTEAHPFRYNEAIKPHQEL